eukprot:2205460-Rhodomonas_salina.2
MAQRSKPTDSPSQAPRRQLPDRAILVSGALPLSLAVVCHNLSSNFPCRNVFVAEIPLLRFRCHWLAHATLVVEIQRSLAGSILRVYVEGLGWSPTNGLVDLLYLLPFCRSCLLDVTAVRLLFVMSGEADCCLAL